MGTYQVGVALSAIGGLRVGSLQILSITYSVTSFREDNGDAQMDDLMVQASGPLEVLVFLPEMVGADAV